MAHLPPRLLPKGTERILLVDSFRPTPDVRARVLREHGIDVSTAEYLKEGASSIRARAIRPRVAQSSPVSTSRGARLLPGHQQHRSQPADRLVAWPPNYFTLDWNKELACAGEPSPHLRPKAKRQTAAASYAQVRKQPSKPACSGNSECPWTPSGPRTRAPR